VVLPPHGPLTDYYADETEPTASCAASSTTRRRTMTASRRSWPSARAPGTRPGPAARQAERRARVLDVGIGTGLVAREALKIIGPSGRLVGVDPSPGMMEQVDLPGVQLLSGRAEALPCTDASFDFLSMGYALRHLADLSAAFAEFHPRAASGWPLAGAGNHPPQGRLATLALKTYIRAVVPTIARVWPGVTRPRSSGATTGTRSKPACPQTP